MTDKDILRKVGKSVGILTDDDIISDEFSDFFDSFRDNSKNYGKEFELYLKTHELVKSHVGTKTLSKFIIDRWINHKNIKLDANDFELSTELLTRIIDK